MSIVHDHICAGTRQRSGQAAAATGTQPQPAQDATSPHSSASPVISNPPAALARQDTLPLRQGRDDLLAAAFRDDSDDSDSDSDLEADMARLRLQRRLSSVKRNTTPASTAPSVPATLATGTQAAGATPAGGAPPAGASCVLPSTSSQAPKGGRHTPAPLVEHRGLMAAAATSSSDDEAQPGPRSPALEPHPRGWGVAQQPVTSPFEHSPSSTAADPLQPPRASRDLCSRVSRRMSFDVAVPPPAQASSLGMAEVCNSIADAEAGADGDRIQSGAGAGGLVKTSRIGVAALWELLEGCLLKVEELGVAAGMCSPVTLRSCIIHCSML